jgi:hypothetical protein
VQSQHRIGSHSASSVYSTLRGLIPAAIGLAGSESASQNSRSSQTGSDCDVEQNSIPHPCSQEMSPGGKGSGDSLLPSSVPASSERAACFQDGQDGWTGPWDTLVLPRVTWGLLMAELSPMSCVFSSCTSVASCVAGTSQNQEPSTSGSWCPTLRGLRGQRAKVGPCFWR